MDYAKAVEKINFDLSGVTIGDAVEAIASGDIRKIALFVNQVTPDIDIWECPFNLLPVIASKFQVYLKAFFDPDTAFKDALDLLGED